MAGAFLSSIRFSPRSEKPTRLAELERKTAAGRYFGEMELRFEYKGRSGAPLQVDYETLAAVARRSGWACELIRSNGSHYLACTRPT